MFTVDLFPSPPFTKLRWWVRTVINMQIIHCLWLTMLCNYTHACVHSCPNVTDQLPHNRSSLARPRAPRCTTETMVHLRHLDAEWNGGKVFAGSMIVLGRIKSQACALTAKLSSWSWYFLITSVNRPLENHYAIGVACKYWISSIHLGILGHFLVRL